MNSRLMIAFLCLFSLSAAAEEGRTETTPRAANEPLTTIGALDLTRYMGTWYEVAKLSNWFQKKCIGYSTAEYSLRGEGKVQVINRCRLENGKIHETTGIARQVGSATSPKLEVNFAPAWLSFIPAVWNDYWVIDLDDHYQLAAVSEPSRKYLWVLSRTPKVDPTTYNELLKRLENKGFDTQKLEVTKQQD